MKAQLNKPILAYCIFNLAFCLQLRAQSFIQFDTTYTPPGYPEGPLLGVLYIPSNPNGAGIITIHTGGGDRHQLHLWDSTLAANGYVVLDIDYYDLLQNVQPSLYPGPPRAIKTAVEFLRKNSYQFGCYTSQIAALGQSNGAMALGETITWDNDDGFFQTSPDINDHLDAAVLYYSMYDNKNDLNSIFDLKTLVKNYFDDFPSLQFKKGNPIEHVSNISSPVLMFHGTADEAIQVEQSMAFRDACIASGKSCELIIFPGAPHSYDYPYDSITFRNRNLFNSLGITSRDTTLAFFQRTLNPYSNECSQTKNYWKNNLSQWSAYSLPMMLGTSNYYNASQLASVLNTSPGIDMSRKLSQQLIAAKLNAMNGASATSMLSSIIAADNLIGARTIPITPVITMGSQEGVQMNLLANALESFNNGNNSNNCVTRYSNTSNKSESVHHLQIYPQPVSDAATISFILLQSQKVTIKIYDLNGRVISTLTDQLFGEGENETVWHVDINAGVYMLRFESEGNSINQKFIIIK